MGERGQIFVKSTKVYIYTHWGGPELLQNVHAAMQWGRMHDEEYFTRALIQEVAGPKSETGSGVGTEIHGDLDWPVVIVDHAAGTIGLGPSSYGCGEDYEKMITPVKTWTFEEFKKISDIEMVAAHVLGLDDSNNAENS